jgi:hypothetical protein
MAREKEKKIVEQQLYSMGFRAAKVPSPADCAAQLVNHPDVQRCILEVFRSLGGLAGPILNPGKWDISTADFVVEFDEEQHFNRYRLMTLDCPLLVRLTHIVELRRAPADN